MVEINVNRCIEEVQKILSEVNLQVDTLIKEKLPQIAKRIANETIGVRENTSCATRYDPIRSPELLLWSMGLVCEAWTLEILRQKTRDGHCHTHKKQTERPCSIGREFHRALYNEAKKSFQDVLTTFVQGSNPKR